MTNARQLARYGRVDPGLGYGATFAYDGDDTIPAEADGGVVTNESATGTINLTLPPAAVGRAFAVYRTESFPIGLAPDSGDTINGLTNDIVLLARYALFQCSVAGNYEVAFSADNNVIDLQLWGAVGDGVADDTAAIQSCHDIASTLSTPRLVTAPPGSYLISSTVTLKASMHGTGGNGYSASFGRARFVPTITDGTACLKATNKGGLDLRNFAVEPAIGSPNPNPSGGNVQNCIGLQLGKCATLAIAATQANPCVITTKYLHTLETGDNITCENFAGMTGLNGNAYTVTRISATQFSLNVNSSGFGAYTSGGLVRPTDLGVAAAVTRGVVENVTVSSCNVNFHLQGWLNRQVGVKSLNGTLGFDGSYLNTSVVDLVTENCWQAFQLLGCAGTMFERIEDEGGGVNDLGAASTIDYCEHVSCAVYAGEGSRSTATPWIAMGGVSACRDINFYNGFAYSGGSGGVSITVDRVNRFTLPVCLNGYSTTASTTPWHGTATFVAATTVAVAFASTQFDGNYQVRLTPKADPVGRLWVSAIADTGFTINNSSSTSIDVDWEMVRTDA